MKKQLLDLLKRVNKGGVLLWIDSDAPASARFVLQIELDNEDGLMNYYGRTLTQAVKRAAEELT